MTRLPIPSPDPDGVVAWVGEHLDGCTSGPLERSLRFRGGQTAADAALGEVHVGRPDGVLGARSVAVTHAPVPGFQRLASIIEPVEVHPWPWLRRPAGGPVRSFSAWRKDLR